MNRHYAHVEVQADLGCGSGPAQRESGAECWMASEGQFFLNGKDSDPHSALAFGCCVAWKDIGGFREVRLLCESLHLLVAEAARIENNSKSISLQRFGTEYI